MQRAVRISVGAILVAVGLLGAVYSVRAARSSQIYHTVKYGAFSDADTPTMAVADACETAFTLYPHNYYLSIEATRRLWPARGVTPAERTAALGMVEEWCDRGLVQNPYPWQLRRTKARLLGQESPAAAADYWEQFVEWQFWNPLNLQVLVEYYARAGRLAEASELLPLLEGRPGYGEAAAALRAGWAAEMAWP